MRADPKPALRIEFEISNISVIKIIVIRFNGIDGYEIIQFTIVDAQPLRRTYP